MRRPASVRASLVAFRATARLLPARFRDDWLVEGARDLEELLLALYARGGAWAVAGAGAAAVADVVRRIPVEWWAALGRRPGIRRGERGPARGPARGERVMGILNELRIAGRALARRPSFTAAAVLTFGLGIGVTVAIFTVVNAVLLRPLAYPDADRIVSVDHHAPGWNFPELGNSHGTLNFLRENADFFSAIAGWRSDARNLIGGARPERVDLVAVQPAMFSVLGVPPALGRPFGPADADGEAAPVAILMEGAWRARFGGDPGVIGRTIELDGVTTEIVGVMPAGFTFADPDAVALVPFPVEPNGEFGSFGIRGAARLAPGVSLETAGRRIAELQPRLSEKFPDLGQEFLEQAGWSATVERLQDRIVGEEVASALWVVLATVGFLLLIACANVANLFLVRAESRQKELAVRAAMGAGSGRIASGFLSEALLLGGVGGAAGVLLAWGGVELLVANGPSSLPRLHEVRMDGASLAFAAALSVIASLGFGAIPMLRYSGGALARILRDGGRASTDGRERHRTRSVLVAAQLALALVLLVGSGLMLRTFDRLRSVDPGFDPDDVLTVGLYLGAGRPAQEAASFYRRVAEEIAGLPGVAHVGMSLRVPLGSGSSNGSNFSVEGVPEDENAPPTIVMYKTIGADYLEALRIPVVAGRGLTPADGLGGEPVVVVNAALAARIGEDAVGKGIRFGGGDSTYLRIVGVVGDVREEGLREDVRPWALLPLEQTHVRGLPLDGMQFVVRMAPGIEAPVAAIRQAVERVDATVPITTIRSMQEIMAVSVAQTSFTMVLLGIAAGVALFLGAIGLFGVISYVVGQRTREIGVRVALGAARADIRRMVFRQSAGVAVAGVVFGLGGSLALTRLMGTILFGISATDPVTFVGAPILLVGVAALATWLPARRASRVDPIEALRTE